MMHWQRPILAIILSCPGVFAAEEPGESPPRLGLGFIVDLDPSVQNIDRGFNFGLDPLAEIPYLQPPFIPQQERAPLVPGPWQSGVFPVWGLHVSMPQIVDATLGLMVGQRRQQPADSLMVSAIAGALIAVRPGWAGVAVDIGYATIITQPDEVMHAGFFGYSLRASLLRTYGDPLQVDGNQTFVGIIASVHIIWSLMVGGYRNLDNDGNDRWLFSLGLGYGL